MMQDVLTVILAGGKGARLEPLTTDRSKPAVPFGGAFRIIDFALSNCINSGLRKILVMTQYKAASLERHIERGWHFLSSELGEFITVRPPEQRIDENWYQGTADALYQNIYTIEQLGPKHVMILSGDHIYQMDYSRFIADHIQSDSDCTIGCIPVSIEEGQRFGVMQVDEENRVVNFAEKPSQPVCIPGNPEQCMASMGIYVFKTEFLFEHLCRDANVRESHRDFGKDIIPSIIDHSRVHAWSFEDPATRFPNYWRDVGTLDSYYDANMDLISVDPQFNLYDSRWPFRSFQKPLPPPKFVFNDQSAGQGRVGYAVDSMVCPGTVVSGGTVESSIIGPSVRVNSYAEVRACILYEGVTIGRYARIRKAIIDKHVVIPEGMRIGYDPEEDRRNGLTVTENGVVAVPKNTTFDSQSHMMKPHTDRYQTDPPKPTATYPSR